MTVPAAPGEPTAVLPDADVARLLSDGELVVVGRMAAASNATLYGTLSDGRARVHCIYKPVAGERPLRDFPRATLSRREVAAHVVSQATGWDIVPPTVWRDGPFGEGSVQLWIDHDPDCSLVEVVPLGSLPARWRPVLRAEDGEGTEVVLGHADDPRLARMAVFDAVIDNADRKGGHVLVAADGHVWGVDHGLSFNVVDKLRSVLWGWHGDPLPAECLDVLAALDTDLAEDGPLAQALTPWIAAPEVRRTRERVRRLRSAGTFPDPDPRGPVIPWPPF